MSLRLLFAVHNHQPEGNFGSVFAEAYDACYSRIVDALLKQPGARVSLHHTGPLLEWLESQRPDYLKRVRTLVERGQVELLGGGFYEPMLSILPLRDAVGQIEMMADWLEKKLGQRPQGMWLAERVWEPGLVQPIVAAGMRFTLLDDAHFRAAGMAGLLRGYYVTERAGEPLAVFPIDKRLREAIPFSELPHARWVLDELDRERGGAVTYGDDGEKFGVWPNTADWVWNKGWLDGFFELIAHAPHIRPTHFIEELEHLPPSGRVYLPTASYEEMGEWSLPSDAQREYLAMRGRLEQRGELERARPFVHGGIWQGFLTKYVEANQMHKRMLVVSQRLADAEAKGTPLPAARQALYRAQCNCAYWHGLFGGIYLNYLRDAVHKQLLVAEAFADATLGAPAPSWAEPHGKTTLYEDSRDLDADLEIEIALRSASLSIVVRPSDGGALEQLAYRDKTFLLTNVLARRPEGYHARLAAAQQQSGGAPASPHDRVIAKEPGLEQLLVYDDRPRWSFVDHFLGDDALAAFARNEHRERGDFVRARWQRADAPLGTIALSRTGRIDDRKVSVDKRYVLDGRTLTVSWSIASEGMVDVIFAPELALTLLDGRSPERVYRVQGGMRGEEAQLGTTGTFERVGELLLVNRFDRFQLAIVPSSIVDVWRFPIETVSNSEGGFERTYQGSVIVPRFPLRLDTTSVEVSLTLTASDL